jgi:predicted O-linked N-acetylglucosamine transferase (SPINDLY family)
LGRNETAVESYDRALALQPGFADAHLNRGGALVGLRRYSAALSAFDKAVMLRPNHAPSYFNRAAALQHLGDYVAAVASYDTAISIDSNYADAHSNLGRALRELRRYEAAIASYDKALQLAKDTVSLRADRRHLMMQVCDWTDLQHDVTRIGDDLSQEAAASNPFYLLALTDAPALQRQAAEKWAAEHHPVVDFTTRATQRRATERIHIGYFSADYHEHATAYLIAQLFELHDRSRFRVSAFSFGPDSNGPMRKRLRAACDEFIDVRHRSDIETVTLARDRRIDIAVDLKGFTTGNRAGIFARRAAPLQVNYLGFPGTMGAPYMDYLIADRTLIPPESQRHYAEKVIYLPHSYQVNDATREISERVPSRAELGLPESGFVYCCFNNSYKILPGVFDRWMRVLTRVENSVLWLLGDNPAAVRNLRREAAARNVSPQRLVFADRIDLPNHLARHRCADLFLDTLPCNAHTTASDALWAGVPVLACPGEGFAARVSSSLLHAIHLPELIAPNPERYEELAVHFAAHREALEEIRLRLHANRLTAPLFDTPRYTRDLETAFIDMYQGHQAHSLP